MKQTYTFEPAPTETITSAGIMTTVIRFEIRKREPEPDNNESTQWECEEVEYNHKEPISFEKDYGPMVSAIIRNRYTQDNVEAITQNYLADPDGRREEFEALQQWRETAKKMIKEIFGTKSKSII